MQSKEDLIVQYIAFTGHRPQDMPEGTTYQRFAAALDALGMDKRRDVHFVVGGALGADTYAAEYALSRNIPYTLILPFPVEVMGSRWREADRVRLNRHAAHAFDVRIINRSGHYDVRSYQQRNEAMVNVAAHVFALWSGKRAGGTANCIRYALTAGRPVYNLLPLDNRLHRINAV